eukprot:Skav203481  [mRNA]  locus=scaffold921:348953:354996:+ [translate_table: standard]
MSPSEPVEDGGRRASEAYHGPPQEHREAADQQPDVQSEASGVDLMSDALSDLGGSSPTGHLDAMPSIMASGRQRNQSEATVLRKSFDMLLMALGNDREAVGDAIYGLKIHALVAIKDFADVERPCRYSVGTTNQLTEETSTS